MNTLQAIHTRRSIRKFTKKPISHELIKELISYAMSAPSANNQQPWHFVIIDDNALLTQIPKFSPYAYMCKEAPYAILVCGNKELSPNYWVQDCAAAIQNLLLAAHEKDLGAVWTGAFPNEERVNGFKSLLNLPQEIMPLGLIVIGYPAETKPQENRYSEERIHYNHW